MDRLTELLLDAREGDLDALEQFVAATQDDVGAMCRYLGDRDNVDDLVQEVYERALTAMPRYTATGPARHWILTIARRTCADAARRRARRRRLQQRVAAFPADDASIGTPGIPAELDELLHQLDPDRRAAFVLTQVSGLRYEEAAAVLDVPIGTIRSRVARAREQLLGLLTGAETGAGAAATGTHGEPAGPSRRPRPR